MTSLMTFLIRLPKKISYFFIESRFSRPSRLRVAFGESENVVVA